MKTLEQEGYRNLLATANPMLKRWRPWIPNKMTDYSTPDLLQTAVIDSNRMQQFIEAFVGKDLVKQGEILKLVSRLLLEIGFNQSIPTIKCLGIALSYVFSRIYRSLQVNEASVQRLKCLVHGNPVLYLPSHRSYMDFVLISYVCYSYDIQMPAIAAGMDFLNMKLVGEMLRLTGAFFMRRSFANDKIYWQTFKEYIHTLMTKFPGGIEFFLEGTRSRSCKSLPPKIGLLSMALEPLFMGEVPDITIVPISISYEKPLEEQLFVYELLGVPKPKESTTGLLKSLKILYECFGSVYFEYGKPVSVKEYLGNNLDRLRHAMQPPHVQELATDELAVISGLANHIVNQQQDRIVITAFNLVAVVFNHSKYRGEQLGLGELCNRVIDLGKMLTRLNAVIDGPITITKLKDSIQIHSNILHLKDGKFIDLVKSCVDFHSIDKSRMKGHKLCNQAMSNAVPIFSLQLYINPTLYWLAPAAFYLIAMKKLSPNQNAVDQEELYMEWLQLRHIFSTEFVFQPNTALVEFKQLTSQLQLLNLTKLESIWVSLQLEQNSTEDLLISLLPPFITCYLQTVEAILENFNGDWVNEKEILCVAQRYSERKLLDAKTKVHPYCLSLDTIALALQSFHFKVGCLDRKRR